MTGSAWAYAAAAQAQAAAMKTLLPKLVVLLISDGHVAPGTNAIPVTDNGGVSPYFS